MTILELRSFLGWCFVINFGLQLLAFLFIAFGSNFVYRMHSKWFNISKEKFESSIYLMMMFYKTTVFIFNVVPYIALTIIAK